MTRTARPLALRRAGLLAGAASSLAWLVAVAATGCGDPPPPPQFRVTFSATTEGAPLPGVEVSIAGRKLGTTGPTGSLGVKLQGREGSVLAYGVKCPPGYRDPVNPPALTLRRFQGLDPAAAARGIEISLECKPAERIAALVVRSGGIPGLPVIMQGQQVATTDASGVAHLVLRLPPSSAFTVGIDTSSNPNIIPANPSLPFTIADNDDILTFDPQLQIRPPPAKVRRNTVRRPTAPPPVPTGPIQIGPTRR